MNFYSIGINETIKEVDGSLSGLTDGEAKSRLAANGRNELKEGKKKNMLVKFFEQFKDVMIIVLLVAAAVSAAVAIIEENYGELFDSGVILFIVVLNAVIGLIQENKAENAMEALKNMNKPIAKVIRNGELKQVAGAEIVVGDIVRLDAGDVVPADLRLIETASLKVEEAALTGESVPSEKSSDSIVDEKSPLGDRKNMAYSGGIVNYGRGKGIVVATGMNTEVGKIAQMLNESGIQTSPLQHQLAKTAKLLSFLVLGIAAIIFAVSALRGDNIMQAFMTSVAIAVAAIPEGLPAVVTIVLAMGVQKMSNQNAIVKNLPAVETLGCCEVICSDKTGTLTLNQMTVTRLFTAVSGNFSVENYNELNTEKDGSTADKQMLVRAMTLCNDSKENNEGILVGDPTETALVYFAKRVGVDFASITKEYKRVDELPFDSERKLMTTVNENSGKKIAYVKGAPDMLVKRCKYILSGCEVREITTDDVKRIMIENDNLGKAALRVLGFAYKTENLQHETLEEDLIFIGLSGMIDPPRKEVKEAVKVCIRAGMRPIMITGDHIVTASAIAREIGILRDGDLVMTGAEIDAMSDEEFAANIQKYSVFARVSPENKVRIVKAYKSFDKIVAMTGDGVNDAPSIKAADIGVGMGITGTDVSKGAADIVLADDNFATIIGAVEQGRKIFSNIKKAVQFLLSANIAEVLCLFIATIFLGVEFLTPVMILWVNLVTDSLPALALGTESAERDIMNQPPRKSRASLFAGKTGKDIILQGVFQAALVMVSFALGNYVLEQNNHAAAMTMAFVSLCLIQLIHSYNLRSQTQSLFSEKVFSNKFLNISFIVGLVLALSVVLIPGLNMVFGTEMLSPVEWLISVGVALLILPTVELQKLIERKINRVK